MAGPGSVALVSSTSDPTGTSRWLRLGQHALLAVLAVVCAVRAIADGTHPAAELAALALFAGWYALGPRVARAGRDGTGWLVGLVLLWGLLVVVSPEDVWLAFPLWLLAGHVLPLLPAVLTSLAVLVVVALEPVRHSGEVSYAAIIGPCIGMVVALGVARAQQALVRDGIERQRLIASLYAAQEESAALTDELARVQRAQGVTSERTRLSRDIHDGIAQGFSSLLLLSRAARAESDPQRRAQLLEHIESGAAQGLEESRRIVGALAPTDLDEGSLAAAIRRVADRFAAECGVRGAGDGHRIAGPATGPDDGRGGAAAPRPGRAGQCPHARRGRDRRGEPRGGRRDGPCRRRRRRGGLRPDRLVAAPLPDLGRRGLRPARHPRPPARAGWRPQRRVRRR